MRSGLSLNEFCALVARFWTHWYEERGNDFKKNPISEFLSYVRSLGRSEETFRNVIFVSDQKWDNADLDPVFEETPGRVHEKGS